MPNDFSAPESATETLQLNEWELDGKKFPLFAFDAPQVIKLPNGTEHIFRLWDETTEKKREDLMKTVVVISPAVINGENPRDVKTDFTRSSIAYYDMMIEKVKGFGVNANDDPDNEYSVKSKVDIGDKQVLVLELVPVELKKAAASRLYGGKIELETADREDEETFDPDFNPFDLDALDITKEVERAENRSREAYLFTLDRRLVIRQEIGSELLKTGMRTPPTNIIRYHFREPNGTIFSKWEMHSHKGYAINLNKGGQRAERFYNLDTVKSVFNSLIVKIEGGSIGGRAVDLDAMNDEQRAAVLAQIPLSIKKYTIAQLFAGIENLGNS